MANGLIDPYHGNCPFVESCRPLTLSEVFFITKYFEDYEYFGIV